MPVLEQVREACRNSGQAIEDHMEDILTMVEIASGAKREIEHVRLSRCPCYQIVQNGDPRNSVIANGQANFAMQTHQQELTGDATFERLNLDERLSRCAM